MCIKWTWTTIPILQQSFCRHSYLCNFITSVLLKSWINWLCPKYCRNRPPLSLGHFQFLSKAWMFHISSIWVFAIPKFIRCASYSGCTSIYNIPERIRQGWKSRSFINQTFKLFMRAENRGDRVIIRFSILRFYSLFWLRVFICVANFCDKRVHNFFSCL